MWKFSLLAEKFSFYLSNLIQKLSDGMSQYVFNVYLRWCINNFKHKNKKSIETYYELNRSEIEVI